MGINFVDPLLADRPGGFAALAADDRPMDVSKIDRADRSDQRLEGNKADSCVNPAQVLDSTNHTCVFDAGSEPHVRHNFADLGGD